MFENSFVTRLNLRCPLHYNNKITHACPRPTCQKSPLLCEECMNSKIKDQHYGHEYELQKIDRYLQNIASTIGRQKPSIQKLYKSILSQKQNQTLLSWQKQKLQHFQSIQNHINTLKFQIQEEISSIVMKFQDELNKEKENIYRQLELYFETYRNKFNHFAELTEPVVVMQKSFLFYQSKNSLTLKLMTQQPSKLNKWLNSLKFNLNRAQLASKKELEYINRVQNLGLVTNELMDDLPRLRNVDFQNQLPQVLKESSKNIMNSLVSFRRGKVIAQNPNTTIPNPSNHIQRSTSMNYIATDHSRSISGNNKQETGKKGQPKYF